MHNRSVTEYMVNIFFIQLNHLNLCPTFKNKTTDETNFVLSILIFVDILLASFLLTNEVLIMFSHCYITSQPNWVEQYIIVTWWCSIASFHHTHIWCLNKRANWAEKRAEASKLSKKWLTERSIFKKEIRSCENGTCNTLKPWLRMRGGSQVQRERQSMLQTKTPRVLNRSQCHVQI